MHTICSFAVYYTYICMCILYTVCFCIDLFVVSLFSKGRHFKKIRNNFFVSFDGKNVCAFTDIVFKIFQRLFFNQSIGNSRMRFFFVRYKLWRFEVAAAFVK